MKRISILLLITTGIYMIACNSNEKSNDNNSAKTEEQILREAIKQYPDSLQLRDKLIAYLAKVENYDMAISEATAVVKKDSLNAPFWFKKADLEIMAEDTTAAIQSYLQSILIAPEPSAIMTLGYIYAAQRNDSALMMAEALLMGQKANANKEALFIKGLYFSGKGDKQKAISFFNDCLKQDYTFMFAYREKGIALYELGQYDEAIATLEKAVTLQNTFDEGYYWMGKCYEKQNKMKDAVESYQAALLANPNYDEATEALKRLKAM